MSASSTKSETAITLLVQARDRTPAADVVEVGGGRWALAHFADISDAPAYTCVSYAWGAGVTRNVLCGGRETSSRTIPVVETILRAASSTQRWTFALENVPRDPQREADACSSAVRACSALWIDALCVPEDGPARSESLRSMGAIYCGAWQVVVVLAASCAPVLEKIRAREPLDPAMWEILDEDSWATRAWSYQEAVNGKRLYFTAQDTDGDVVGALDLLEAISPPGAHPGWSRRYRKLDSLQGLLAEFRIADVSERSAYQVMASSHGRVCAREDDLFHAMVGAITPLHVRDGHSHDLPAAEYFMRVCESKGDYSFIYSIAPRDTRPGRGWRPVAGPMPPVLGAVVSEGQAQRGSMTPTHLQLHEMCRMRPGVAGSRAQSIVRRLLEFDDTGTTPQMGSEEGLLERLRQLGFSGRGDRLELDRGYFFPQSARHTFDEMTVFVAQRVSWWWGGMGVLVLSNGAHVVNFVDVGVFVGDVPKTGEAINVA